MHYMPIPVWVLAIGGVMVSILVPYCRVGATMVGLCALCTALGFRWGQRKQKRRK